MQVLPASEEPSKEVTKLVKVTSFATLPVAEIEKPSTADHAMVWFSDHASSVGLGLLGFFSLLMVRSIVRSVPAPVASSGEPELKVAATPVDESGRGRCFHGRSFPTPIAPPPHQGWPIAAR